MNERQYKQRGYVEVAASEEYTTEELLYDSYSKGIITIDEYIALAAYTVEREGEA